MTRIAAALLLGLAACMGTQSARVLAPGKTAVTATLARTSEVSDSNSDGVIWTGQVAVRHGFGSRADGAIVFGRTPGFNDISFLGVQPKVQVTDPGSSVTLSFSAGLGFLWEDGPGSDGLETNLDLYGFNPTVYLGADLSPTMELVVAPSWMVMIPDGGGDSENVVGLSLGLHITDVARTWAVHPELQFLSVGSEDTKLLTLGLAISAGN